MSTLNRSESFIYEEFNEPSATIRVINETVRFSEWLSVSRQKAFGLGEREPERSWTPTISRIDRLAGTIDIEYAMLLSS